ncbi:MAG: DUF1684 domain-containing protein [Bacteroidota bacterium]
MFRTAVYFSLLICFAIPFAQAQNSYVEEVLTHRKDKDEKYADKAKSPVPDEYLTEFGGLNYFEVDSSFKVRATLERFEKPSPHTFNTTKAKKKRTYILYGTVHFMMKGKKSKLTIYYAPISGPLRKKQKMLFLPFRDQTNGVSTYGGGRYLEIEDPEGDELVLDFNKAYNPYCAYGGDFACVVPPRDNLIEVEVMAGEKEFLP